MLQKEEPLSTMKKQTQVWISDLVGIIPSITGKIELVYEGEQEGPYQVAMNLLTNLSVHSLFNIFRILNS